MKQMIRNVFFVGLWAGVMSPLCLMAASLGIRATPEHLVFVRDEGVTFTVSIKNFGEKAFIVDDYGEYVDNSVEIRLKKADGGYLLVREGSPLENVMVVPQGTQDFSVNLLRWFPEAKEGSYFVQFIAHRKGEVVGSELIKFDIVAGIEIGSVTRPIPGDDSTSRTYTLLYWPRNQVEAFFMRVTEGSEDRVIGLVRLGNIVRYAKPKVDFAGGGILTVTHQASRDILVRTTLRSTRSEFSVVNVERILNK